MVYYGNMAWEVVVTKKVQRQYDGLPSRAKDAVIALLRDIEINGPVRGNWPNFGKLKGTKKGVIQYHCHLIKGNPTYVCCWEVIDKEVKLMEVYYVGTHEKAPY